VKPRLFLLATCLAALGVAACGGGDDEDACSTPGVICTIAGTGVAGLTPDGMAAAESDLYSPMDIAVGPDGLLYLLDWNNHRVRVIDENGLLRTVAGTGLIGDGPPGSALEAAFNHPTALAFDAQGRMFVAAWHNSRINVVDLAAGTLANFAGTGARAYAGDGGAAAAAVLDLPASLAFDSEQNLYVMDQANQVIRRITPDGVISRFAGTCLVGDPVPGQEPSRLGETDKWGWRADDVTSACEAGFGGDGGPAVEARIAQPVGQAAEPAGRLAVDAEGNVYFADSGNHRVRKIDRDGIITTVAGNGSPGFSGDGGAATDAQLNNPVDVEVAADGSLYIADTYNSCVRVVDPQGVILTVAGVCGSSGFNGDGGDAIEALLDRPFGIELDGDGHLYVADTYNQCIRKVVLRDGT
jgi:DNA-binding beta-propeller fold protein YncE